MTRVYYKEAVGAMVVFDVTRVGTFDAVSKWKNDIDCKVTLPPDDRPIPVVLLANKVFFQKSLELFRNVNLTIKSSAISLVMAGIRLQLKWISTAKRTLSLDGLFLHVAFANELMDLF